MPRSQIDSTGISGSITSSNQCQTSRSNFAKASSDRLAFGVSRLAFGEVTIELLDRPSAETASRPECILIVHYESRACRHAASSSQRESRASPPEAFSKHDPARGGTVQQGRTRSLASSSRFRLHPFQTFHP